MPLQGPILGCRGLPLPPAFLWKGETACRSPKWAVNVHQVGVSVRSLGCEKKILEPLKMHYLKNKGNMHFQHSVCGLTEAATPRSYVRWPGLASPWGHFSGKAGASPPRVGVGGIDGGIPPLPLFQRLATHGHFFMPGLLDLYLKVSNFM